MKMRFKLVDTRDFHIATSNAEAYSKTAADVITFPKPWKRSNEFGLFSEKANVVARNRFTQFIPKTFESKIGNL